MSPVLGSTITCAPSLVGTIGVPGTLVAANTLGEVSTKGVVVVGIISLTPPPVGCTAEAAVTLFVSTGVVSTGVVSTGVVSAGGVT